MQNPNDVFYLARYAHNQLAPLFEQAQLIDPTIHYYIEMGFAKEQGKFAQANTINVNSHWDRGTSMFQQSSRMFNKADLDRFVAKVRKDVGQLRLDARVEW